MINPYLKWHCIAAAWVTSGMCICIIMAHAVHFASSISDFHPILTLKLLLKKISVLLFCHFFVGVSGLGLFSKIKLMLTLLISFQFLILYGDVLLVLC